MQHTQEWEQTGCIPDTLTADSVAASSPNRAEEELPVPFGFPPPILAKRDMIAACSFFRFPPARSAAFFSSKSFSNFSFSSISCKRRKEYSISEGKVALGVSRGADD